MTTVDQDRFTPGVNNPQPESSGQQPTVGVVIPLYNKKQYVVRAVESVLGQTYGEFRLTIVNDGSTDGGAECVERISDPRISVIHQPCRGPGAARNIGMRATQADWIGLLDADDEWETTFLEKTTAAVRRAPGIVAVFTNIAVRGAKHSKRSQQEEGVIDDYFAARMRFKVAMTSSSVLLRKSLFLSIGGFREDYRYAEDIEAWFRLSCDGLSYYLPEALSKIEIHDSGSITQAIGPIERAAGLKMLLNSYEAYRQAGRIPGRQTISCQKFMEHQRGRMALHMVNAGERLAAAQILWSSVPVGSHTWREYLSCITRMLAPRRHRPYAV